MSVLPLYIEIARPRPVFGTRLDHSNLLSGFVLPAILAAQRSRCQELQKRNSVSQEKAKADEGQAKPHFDDSGEQRLSQGLSQRYKFEVSLDVQYFSPEEISVKTADGCIVVEGKHEEKQDEHGYISQRYALPEGCHPDTVQSRLSSDGVLTVTAPWKQPAPAGERAVPITHTGPVRATPSTSQQQKDVQE